MSEAPPPPAGPARPPRILEVGNHHFFLWAAPEQTEFFWSSHKPPGVPSTVLGPRALLRTWGKLRRGEYDLVAIHVPQYAPWHPRSWLTALRDWHVRAPLGLFSLLAPRMVAWFHNVPVIGIDLSDSCLIGRHNFSLLRACKAFFKRELPTDHWIAFCKSSYPNFPGRRWRSRKRNVALVRKLRPISYGSLSITYGELPIAAEPPVPEKTADVFFAGAIGGNSSLRMAGIEEMRALAAEGYVIDLPDRLAPQEFFKRMSAAWLAWSPAGLGWDCARHYEAPLVGSVPLISMPSILRDAPLEDGKHCVLYAAEPGGLGRAVRQALGDKPRLRDMAQAAGRHVALHHTVRARAERVTIAVLGRKLDGTRIDGAGQA
jgi:hypothetical protein